MIGMSGNCQCLVAANHTVRGGEQPKHATIGIDASRNRTRYDDYTPEHGVGLEFNKYGAVVAVMTLYCPSVRRPAIGACTVLCTRTCSTYSLDKVRRAGSVLYTHRT